MSAPVTMGYRDDIIAALVVFLILDGAAVGARLYVRTKMLTRGFGWDDTALCITFVRPAPHPADRRAHI